MKLMIKRCQNTGKKYLHYTRNRDPEKYMGSGTYWVNHIKKHGGPIINCTVIETDNQELITNYALYMSEKLNIVDSEDWANQIPETCLQGCTGWSAKTREKIAKSWTPDRRVKTSEWSKALWEDPQFRKKMEQVSVDFWNNPENRKATSDRWAGKNNPQYGSSRTGEDNPMYGVHRYGKDSPNYGNKWTPEMKEAMSIKKRGKKLLRHKCPHCGRIVGGRRWHFDNCKHKENI